MRQAFGWPSCWAESSLVLAELLGQMEKLFEKYDAHVTLYTHKILDSPTQGLGFRV